MERKITKNRKGKIGNTTVAFTVIIKLNKNQIICAAEGNILTPDDFHQQNSGTTQTLEDIDSNTKFSIFVSTSRFSFVSDYKGVDALF